MRLLPGTRPEPVVQPQPRRVLHWHARWSGPPVTVRGLEHLVVILSTLAPGGAFGGVTSEATPRWAQVKRMEDRWVVEVHDGHEGWPRVVLPGQGEDAIFASLSTPAGALWSHHAAASVAWSWLHGHLPEGFALVEAPGG